VAHQGGRSGGSGSNRAESAFKPLTYKKSGELADRHIKGYTLIRSGCSTLAASVCRAASIHQGRVRRISRVRHPRARVPEASLRRVRSRQASGVQLQAARVLPLVRRAADVADGSAPGGPCHPARAGAPMGAVATDPAARAAGRAARAGHAGAPGGAARAHAPSAGQRPAQGRRRPRRRRHADPALRIGRQPQHTSSRPAAERGVPVRCRWRAGSSSKWVRPPTTRCMRCCRRSSPG
jgi:hypothetical protein